MYVPSVLFLGSRLFFMDTYVVMVKSMKRERYAVNYVLRYVHPQNMRGGRTLGFALWGRTHVAPT